MQPSKLNKIICEKAYQEALNLLLRSEGFLKTYQKQTQEIDSQETDMRVNYEMTRVTARLGQVMAWLLAQKGAFVGEISLDEANSQKYLIERDEFCLYDPPAPQKALLPLAVRDLLDESLSLYKRVLILSGQITTSSVDQMLESEN